MADKSNIEWTDATWNPIKGCSRVSEGCRNCYAERFASRMSGPGKAFDGLVHKVGNEWRWTGEVRLDEKALMQPLYWKAPRRIFVNSMSDLFHEKATDDEIDRAFSVMNECPQHIFQILTKRPDRMFDYAADRGPFWELDNVWIGVSTEDQRTADERIPWLLKTGAVIRFISAEPLLGPIDLTSYLPKLDWVIVGGESGPSARPTHPAWVRSLRDQCSESGVPFFFKQWGQWHPDALLYRDINGQCPPPNMKIGKRRAGRILDGRTWDEMPITKEQS